MKCKFPLLVVFLVAMCVGSVRVNAADPRLQWIGSQELQNKIRSTPLADTRRHIYLLSRASSSSLDWLSYKEYSALWQKDQNAGYTNLYWGMSALNFYNSQYSPWKKPTLSAVQLAAIRRNAGKSLLKASLQLPSSDVAQLAYGYFAWQYGGSMNRGLEIIKQVEQRNPKLPSVHATLGRIYDSQSGNAYNLGKAEQEYLEAVHLDPNYAAPRSSLVFFYLGYVRDVSKAHKQYKVWLSLLPSHLLRDPGVLHLQEMMLSALAQRKS
jgi:hypothetical protein